METCDVVTFTSPRENVLWKVLVITLNHLEYSFQGFV